MGIISTVGAIKEDSPSVVVISTHTAIVVSIDSVVGIIVKAFHWFDTVAVNLLLAIVGVSEVR
jgi:selenophosphate synthase